LQYKVTSDDEKDDTRTMKDLVQKKLLPEVKKVLENLKKDIHQGSIFLARSPFPPKLMYPLLSFRARETGLTPDCQAGSHPNRTRSDCGQGPAGCAAECKGEEGDTKAEQ